MSEREVRDPDGLPADPAEVYGRCRSKRLQQVAALQRRERIISNGRLVLFLSAVGLAVCALALDLLSPLWIFSPLFPFVALVFLHQHVTRRRERAQHAADFYERGLARLEHRWQGKGTAMPPQASARSHPYAADLDILGPGSLFELLCTARTQGGEDLLARWLCEPAPVVEVRARQEAVCELRSRLELREELAVLGGGVRAGVQPERVTSWGEAPPFFCARAARATRIAATLGSFSSLTTLTLWASGSTGPLPLLVAGLAAWLATRLVQGRLQKVVQAVEQPGRELMVLSLTLARLEQEPFLTPRLQALREATRTGGVRASAAIRALDRLVALLDSRRNALFAPLGIALMWTVHLGLWIESWRCRHGQSIGRWLRTIAELEALGALAGYAYEHPRDPFPELAEKGPLFEGEDLGHPLLPDESCVRNSVLLGNEVRAWIVSGSNMSGKSTLLRTVGINAVLAQAGAPVRAARLRISPLRIGATIRILDSLHEGRSRFYAEITRLKELMALTGEKGHLLFLLDEVLHGTNSHDRRIGAAALLLQLVDRGAVGLMTTHDLALAEIARQGEGRIANVHFSDRLEDGTLVFDYKVQPGVVTRSNALALMRAVGLQV